ALAAAAGDALTRGHVTPLGQMPGPALAGFTTLDIVVHGWDLATATGQPADLDGRLAAHVMGFAEQALATPDSRAGRIGPAAHAAWALPVPRGLSHSPGPPPSPPTRPSTPPPSRTAAPSSPSSPATPGRSATSPAISTSPRRRSPGT